MDKARLAEIGIEHRVRSEELAALSAIHTTTIEKQQSANTDLTLAKVLCTVCMYVCMYVLDMFPVHC